MDREILKLEKQALAKEERPPRAREAAKRLGISEAEYVALDCGDKVQALDMTRLTEILQSVVKLGEVMALTRNDAGVFESHGCYEGAEIRNGLLIFNATDSSIDLRLRIKDWRFGFAVDENGRQSMQFFDVSGRAVHKVYVTEKSDVEAYLALIDEFSASNCYEEMKAIQPASPIVISEPKDLDVAGLRKDWNKLENAHQVNALLKAYGMTRPQVYACLDEGLDRLPTTALKSLLEEASDKKWLLNLFLPNGKATQIHHGKVNKIMEMGPWLNVLDPKFNLHLNLELTDSVWRVMKEVTGTGQTYSVELFDEHQQSIMMIYSAPEADAIQHQQWRDFVGGLET